MEVRNRFKGLDLIERVLDELWMEVSDIVQETGSKTIHMEKKCKRAKWLSDIFIENLISSHFVRTDLHLLVRDACLTSLFSRYNKYIIEGERLLYL